MLCLGALELACDSGGDKTVAAVVRNIFYFGMPRVIGDITGHGTGGNAAEESGREVSAAEESAAEVSEKR